MKRYKELIFNEKTYTEQYKINEILLDNGFDWFLDCEVENCRLEITKNTLVFNSGVFFNGNWVYGVFRDGQWKYGTWEGGVWYNGTWYNGIFKNGLIFGGRFLNGKIEGGEIRGGDFYGIHIGEQVTDSSMEYEERESGKVQTGNPQNKGQMQKIQTIQPEKIEEKIKRFERFVNEAKENNITKEDIYKKLRKLYLDTGQGLESKFVDYYFPAQHKKVLQELVDEGKVKKVRDRRIRDEFYCLTGVYCLEEENGRSLDFVRRYLGIKGNPNIEKRLQEYLDRNPEERIKLENEYKEWLEKNKDILEKSFRKNINEKFSFNFFKKGENIYNEIGRKILDHII